MLRLTWQMSSNHKFSIYYDEINKYRGHGMNAGDDPLTASQVWTSPRYNSAAAKYTGTLSSSMLIEGGYSFNYEEYVITNQDGVNKTPFTDRVVQPSASRRDANLVTLTQRAGQLGRALSRSVRPLERRFVRHRRPQLQDRVPVQLGPLHQHARDQRGPAAGLPHRASRAR